MADQPTPEVKKEVEDLAKRQNTVAPSLEPNPWTVDQWTDILKWLVNRAAFQIKDLREKKAAEEDDTSDAYKKLAKQEYNKINYYKQVVKLLQELNQVKGDKTGSDILSLDDLNKFREDSYDFVVDPITGEKRKRRPGEGGGAGADGGGAGSEEAGKKRSVLLSNPFTSNAQLLPIKQLVYAYRLQDDYPLLAKGPEALIKGNVAEARADSLAMSLSSNFKLEGGLFSNYINQLSGALSKIKERYSEYRIQNFGENPDYKELAQFDWLMNGIATLIKSIGR